MAPPGDRRPARPRAIAGPPSRRAIAGPPSRRAIAGPPSRRAIAGPPSRRAIAGGARPCLQPGSGIQLPGHLPPARGVAAPIQPRTAGPLPGWRSARPQRSRNKAGGRRSRSRDRAANGWISPPTELVGVPAAGSDAAAS
ncbi:hypothetical protein F1D05_11725 [Kribbella qitaiheensis]|uniref:Uncharacterized protein n=1 Tax=Kribbella qitaiheensis TaxID=1544730 RepID=A0A7G6WWT4_9ACTN|nr:hypothetical protein F1D05_11725 [Kribbella qitaiheensis]